VHMITSTFHSIVDRDIQEVCGSSRILTALVLKFTGARWGAVALLTSDAKHFSGVEKSAFADILSKATWSHTYLLSTGT